MSTCMMCTSLYVKANGDVPCWDDVGESHILTRFSPSPQEDGLAPPLFHSPALRHVREAHRAGRLPFPGLCDRCGVLGHGEQPATSTPTSMQVLHIESSYLCHLSCPLCIPATARRSLAAPPYHMSVESMRRMMERLRDEGVTTIRMIHFEGRGDPLTNPKIDELIAIGKEYFPAAVCMATTHASYPPRPRLATCGLDVLRASIDGAFPDSYARYRVGGVLERALAFLASLRDARRQSGSNLRVIWKYILFEWNDSDPELRQAAALAADLECDLRFCLTHSPGRSRRFADAAVLQAHLRLLRLDASIEQTYQLAPSGTANAAVIEGTAAEQVERFLKSALAHAQASRHQPAVRDVARALGHDPGLAVDEGHGTAVIRAYLETVLAQARFALTLSWLAAISRTWGDGDASTALLRRYLEILPDASDRDHVRQHLIDVTVSRAGERPPLPDYVETLLRAALARAVAHDTAGAIDGIAGAIATDPGVAHVVDRGDGTIRAYLPELLDRARFPLTLSWLAAICREWADGESSIALLRRYLELAPSAPDADHVRECLQHAAARQVELALTAARAHAEVGERSQAIEMVVLALGHDPGLAVTDEGISTIRRHTPAILAGARFPVTLSWLAAISRVWGDEQTSTELLRRYLELAPRAPDRRHVRRHMAVATGHAMWIWMPPILAGWRRVLARR